MTFKIIGYNTLNGIRLQRILVKIANKVDAKVTIKLLESNENNLPILYINDKLISKGKVLSERELTKYIRRINI